MLPVIACIAVVIGLLSEGSWSAPKEPAELQEKTDSTINQF